MQHVYAASCNKLLLRPLLKKDIELLRLYRNNREQNPYLRPLAEISQEQQQKWFEQYEMEPGHWAFALQDTQAHGDAVGSVALYHPVGKNVEFGRFMVSPHFRGRGIGKTATKLTVWMAIEKLGFETVVLYVHECNAAAIASYKNAGFAITGERAYMDGYCEWEMALTKNKARPFFTCGGGSVQDKTPYNAL